MQKRDSQPMTDTSKSSFQSDSNLRDDIDSGSEEEYIYELDEPVKRDDDRRKLPSKTGEYYHLEYKYVKPTQADFDLKKVHQSKLFNQTRHLNETGSYKEIMTGEDFCQDRSILVSGFGMRNVSSFQNILKMTTEQRRKFELRKLWRDKKEQEKLAAKQELERVKAAASARVVSIASTSTAASGPSSSDFLSQTDTKTTDTADDKEMRLNYLLGLETEMEEEADTGLEAEDKREESAFKYSSSKSTREAQKYLRVHRVFECFQFIIAHLLSANAENPIEFILNLLNRCLLYRAGLGDPPLLYEKKHINQLFNLMDRLQTGFIDFREYKSGMKTLGICSFNDNPDINAEDLISKDTFIEEAYEAELAIFNEFVKKRAEQGKKKSKLTPSLFVSGSVPSVNPPFFIPSELLRFREKTTDNFDGYIEG